MRFAIALSIGMALVHGPARAQPAFDLDANGRTVRATSNVSPKRAFKIAMPAPGAFQLCGNAKLAQGVLQLSFEEHDSVFDPRVVPRSATPVKHEAGSFTITPTRAGFLVYNIEQLPVPLNDAHTACQQLIDLQKLKEGELKGDLERAEHSVAVGETSFLRWTERLKSEQQDALAYSGITGTAAEVAKLIQGATATRSLVIDAARRLDEARENLSIARKALVDYPESAEKELNATVERAQYLLDTLTRGAIIKIGAVFVGDRREAIFYDFSTRPSDSTLQLQPLGDYPTLTQDERAFAVITNVDTRRHQYAFRMSSSVTAGSAVNTEPVRPTFAVGAESLSFTKAADPVSEHALRDVVLPVRDTVPPNGVVEVTIVTERPSADPKKLETITLVEKVKFPQFRARYRYNFTTGLFRSSLRDSTYTKVKIQDDIAETTAVNEALYRVDSYLGAPVVRPVFAISYYLAPIDIQSSIGWRELIPAPTIGFSFDHPQDNVYAGFAHEVMRNLQVFYGWHFGATTEVVARNDASEEKDGTAVATRQRHLSKGSFTLGVTFNIAAIAKVFK